MATLNGKYHYRSFTAREGTAPSVKAEIAAPWTPPGVLEVTTDGNGKVTGTLSFPPFSPVVFTVTGSVTAPSGDIPEGVLLKGEASSAVYDIRGFFLSDKGSDHIVGTVVAIQNDLGPSPRPNGTSGPFYLFPITS